MYYLPSTYDLTSFPPSPFVCRRALVPHLPERAQEEAEAGARDRHGVRVPPRRDRPARRLRLPQPGVAARAKHVQGRFTGFYTGN